MCLARCVQCWSVGLRNRVVKQKDGLKPCINLKHLPNWTKDSLASIDYSQIGTHLQA